MGRGYTRRKKIFDRYSANLNEYLISVNKQLLHPKSGLPLDITGLLYICPLCYNVFNNHHLKDIPGENCLTEEHNPPESMRGKAAILTCETCNNTNGSNIDHLVRNLLTTEAFLHSENTSMEAQLYINGKGIKGKIVKSGHIVKLIPKEKSNPWDYNIARKSIADRKPFSVAYKLDLPEWSSYSLGMLKIAYLKAFEYFGYHFADKNHGQDIREVLKGEKPYPAPNNGVIDIFAPDEYLGIQIVREPEELQSMIITQKITFEYAGVKVEKNIPVILPLPSKGGWSLLGNFHRYLNTEPQLKVELIRVLQIPVFRARDYYQIFQ